MTYEKHTQKRAEEQVEQKYFCHIRRPEFKRLLKEAYKIINAELFHAELPSIRLNIAKFEKLPMQIVFGRFWVYQTVHGFYVVDDDPIDRLAEHPMIEISSNFAFFDADNPDITTFALFETLAHEMIHAYCYLNHIDGTNYYLRA